LLIDEEHVDWEAHEEGMNGSARCQNERGVLSQLASSQESFATTTRLERCFDSRSDRTAIAPVAEYPRNQGVPQHGR
jgi:hypothetical protein